MSDVDWDKVEDLSTKPASVIAKRLGVSTNAVYKARDKRGLVNQREKIDWDRVEDLGTAKAKELADRLGTTTAAVYQARFNRGLTTTVVKKEDEIKEIKSRLDKIEKILEGVI